MADGFDVVLLPTFAQVEDWRKRRACSVAEGLFSQTVTTFGAWIADLWELHGDGRAIVDSLQRQVIMQAAFAQAGGLGDDGLHGEQLESDLPATPGVVALAADCVRVGAGVPAFEYALDQAESGKAPAGLAEREVALLRGARRYFALVEQAGLVEVGTAAAILSQGQSEVFVRPLRVLVDEAAPLDWISEAFFRACPQLQAEVRLAQGSDGIGRVPEGIGLAFGFPSGRYAQPALAADLVRASGGGESVSVIVCKDPLALYKQVEEPLLAAGFKVCVQAQVPFASTDFGRQFMQMALVLHGNVWSSSDLSDAARSPFSGFSAADGVQIDKELRENRLAQRDECLARLRVASDEFSQLEELASDPEADILLGVFEQIAFTAPGRSAAWRAEQLAAASALRSCTAAARRVGGDIESCIEVLEGAKVGVSYEGTFEGAPEGRRVIVTTQQVAAQMGAGSCTQLILCDLTSEDYPVADKDNAAATLFGKLGLTPSDTSLARARRTFAALQGLPTERFVVVRPLNDWDGAPTYPAAVLQELIDAYRIDPASDEDLDDAFGVPSAWLEHAAQRGEELLFANAEAGAPGLEQPIWGSVEPNWESPDSHAMRNLTALPRRGEQGRVVAEFSPSPSQVESYLECPRKWFVQSRLNVEGLDEGFGALERGSFAHAALQRFYQRFQQAVAPKVLPDNLGQAKELMRRVLDEIEAEQYDLEPGSGRYVAVDQMERREVAACKEQLVAYLDFESRLLPNFHPAYLEYAIKPEDGVTYAGHPFMGIVDRIDVDDAGNAVIIDYKGSVTKAHQIADATDAKPGKVQTRMYAQVVGRALGLNVVGALYVSYGKRHACGGAFDPHALEAAHLPDMSVEACSCAGDPCVEGAPPAEHALLPFSDMLDRTEVVVAGAIAAMEAGEVTPAPSSADSCAYCLASMCPTRSA